MNPNLIAIIILAAVVAACVLLLQTKYKDYAAQVLFYLVTQAEREFGGGTGQLKYAAVFTWLYEQLPTVAKFVLPKRTVELLIESAVSKMKEYLAGNSKANELVIDTK